MLQPLSLEHLKRRLHYAPGTGVFTWRLASRGTGAGDIAGCDCGLSPGGKRRVVICIDRRSYRAGRLAWLYMTGVWPTHLVDHKDGDYTNQRWLNLRDIPNQQNVENQHKAAASNKSSGLLGVTWDKRISKWKAQIKVNQKNLWLGSFSDPQEAHQAYLAAKRSLHAGCTI